MLTTQEMYQRLRAPFSPRDIALKPGKSFYREGKLLAQARPYVRFRSLLARLDEVFGWEGWSTRFWVLAQGALCCRLTVRLEEGRMVVKEAVAGVSS